MITINKVRVDQWVFGGLLAISLVILQAFISSGIFDLTGAIAIFAFAFAVPQLAIVTLISIVDKDGKIEESGSCVGAIFLIFTLLTDFIGITTAFWHYSWIAGVLFLASGCIGVVYLAYWEKHL